MKPLPLRIFCCALALSPLSTVAAKPVQAQASSTAVLPSYVTLANLVTRSPLILDATVRTAERLRPEEAPGLAPGNARFLVQADVAALIRGPAGVPTQVSYIVDLPLDSRGKAPKLKKQRVLLFARQVPSQPAQLQLTGAGSQLAWRAETDSMVRGIARDLVAANAAPAITGVGNAFHVPGSLPGEGETQVFLQTASGAPVSLQILRRPGETTRWSVSLGDIVDEASGAPQRDTFLWYRLACGLPRALPAESVESDDPQNAAKAREDYQFVLRDLGPCA